MVGNRSTVITITVPNSNARDDWKVGIQLNKNGGVCDIILPFNRPIPTAPKDTSNGEAVRAYNQAKKDYEAWATKKKAVRSAILNVVQGRPIEYAVESVETLSFRILNSEEGL